MTNPTTVEQNFIPLAKGQVWQTRAARIQILGVANQFIHYTITTRLGRRRTTAQVSGIEPMSNYLKLTAARLVRPQSGVSFSIESCRRRRSVRGFRGGRLWTKRTLPICLGKPASRTK